MTTGTTATMNDVRHFNSLNAKSFRRVLEGAARSPLPVPDALARSIAARIATGRLPLVCKTIVLLLAPSGASWVPLRELVLADLAKHPEDALTVVKMMVALGGWPAATFMRRSAAGEGGPVFQATIFVEGARSDKHGSSDTGWISHAAVAAATTRKGAAARAAVWLLVGAAEQISGVTFSSPVFDPPEPRFPEIEVP